MRSHGCYKRSSPWITLILPYFLFIACKRDQEDIKQSGSCAAGQTLSANGICESAIGAANAENGAKGPTDLQTADQSNPNTQNPAAAAANAAAVDENEGPPIIELPSKPQGGSTTDSSTAAPVNSQPPGSVGVIPSPPTPPTPNTALPALKFLSGAPVQAAEGAPHVVLLYVNSSAKGSEPYVAFSHLDQVKDINFSFSNGNLAAAGNVDQSGLNLQIAGLRFPVKVKFNFKSQTCSVDGYAGFVAEQYKPDCKEGQP